MVTKILGYTYCDLCGLLQDSESDLEECEDCGLELCLDCQKTCPECENTLCIDCLNNHKEFPEQYHKNKNILMVSIEYG
jgi:hypothetical protein